MSAFDWPELRAKRRSSVASSGSGTELRAESNMEPVKLPPIKHAPHSRRRAPSASEPRVRFNASPRLEQHDDLYAPPQPYTGPVSAPRRTAPRPVDHQRLTALAQPRRLAAVAPLSDSPSPVVADRDPSPTTRVHPGVDLEKHRKQALARQQRIDAKVQTALASIAKQREVFERALDPGHMEERILQARAQAKVDAKARHARVQQRQHAFLERRAQLVNTRAAQKLPALGREARFRPDRSNPVASAVAGAGTSIGVVQDSDPTAAQRHRTGALSPLAAMSPDSGYDGSRSPSRSPSPSAPSSHHTPSHRSPSNESSPAAAHRASPAPRPPAAPSPDAALTSLAFAEMRLRKAEMERQAAEQAVRDARRRAASSFVAAQQWATELMGDQIVTVQRYALAALAREDAIARLPPERRDAVYASRRRRAHEAATAPVQRSPSCETPASPASARTDTRPVSGRSDASSGASTPLVTRPESPTDPALLSARCAFARGYVVEAVEGAVLRRIAAAAAGEASGRRGSDAFADVDSSLGPESSCGLIDDADSSSDSGDDGARA